MFHMSRVRIVHVSVEGSMKRGKRGLDDEGNVTDMKERETNEERQTRLVNLCCRLPILVIEWYHMYLRSSIKYD